MAMFFCYTVFGRRSKTPILGSSKTGLKAVRRGNMESRATAESDLALAKKMDANAVAGVTMLKGDERQQDVRAGFVIDCNALIDSVHPEHLGSEKGFDSVESPDVHESVVDIRKLEDPHPEPELHHHDVAKSGYESHVCSSYSQGTLHGDVSLSVGEGTFSGHGRATLVPRKDGARRGGSLGACKDASSEDSIGGFSNRSSHGQGSHDVHSERGASAPKEFVYDENNYSDDDGAQAALNQAFTRLDVEAEDCHESAHMFFPVDVHVHNDDAYSRHASDPGFYEREVLKMSPSAPGDGSDSPVIGANEQFGKALDGGERVSVEAGDEKAAFMPVMSSEGYPSNQGVLQATVDPSFDRVKDWINSLQQADVDFGDLEENLAAGGKGISPLELPYDEAGETSSALHSMEHASVDYTLVHAAVRALHPSSTVAHVSGIGLREVPSLGMFGFLKTLNLSANLIVHVPVGCLPRSLHSLDLSRNRIAQIEGFRELTRLRVLNLSYNRISRIGHGLANCTLIKELYLAGNKIGEVEGLHRLLKLAVLDLSFNKLTTSKALGQLAANYGSLLALNLLGNPILTNFSEDQMRKLVTALTPHVTYLNKQPIKVVSVREAALDSVARAALGTSQRYGKSRDAKAVRKPPAAQSSAVKKKPPTHHGRHSDKKLVSGSSTGHHRPHHSQHGKASVTLQGTDPTSSEKVLEGFQNVALGSRVRPMPRSRSADILAAAALLPKY